MYLVRAKYDYVFNRQQLHTIICGLWPEAKNPKIDWRRYPMWAPPAKGQYKFKTEEGYERGAMIFALDGMITSRDETWFVYGPFENRIDAREYAYKRIPNYAPSILEIIPESEVRKRGWLVSRPYTDG